jgi:two-component system, NtrC family, response regulator HydG
MAEPHAPSILIVDDDPAILMSHTIILKHQGYEVSQADSIKSAKSQLSERMFDLLICDLMLEDGSGIDVVKEAVQRDPQIPVLLMTGYSDTTLPESLSQSKVEVVAKPADIPALLRKLKTLLDERKNGNAAKP